MNMTTDLTTDPRLLAGTEFTANSQIYPGTPTLAPASAAVIAAEKPADPAPITAIS